MPKGDEYLVYGDDDRVEQEKLKDLSDLADDLLTADTKKTARPADDLEDIEDELMTSDTAEPDSEEEHTEDMPAAKPGKPKLKPTKFFWIMIGFVVVFIIGIIFVLVVSSGKPKKSDSPVSTPAASETAEAEKTAEPEKTEAPEKSAAPITEPVNKEGYLKAVDKSKVYTLSESLAFAKTINDTTKDYLTYAISVVSDYQKDQTVDIEKQLSVKKEMLGYDIATLKTYETMFDTYSGGDYIRVAEDRLNNVKGLYDAAVADYSTVNDLIVKINEYIEKENTNAEEAKNKLIAYLNTNGVTYHVDDAQISYDELQFVSGQEESTGAAEKTE